MYDYDTMYDSSDDDILLTSAILIILASSEKRRKRRKRQVKSKTGTARHSDGKCERRNYDCKEETKVSRHRSNAIDIRHPKRAKSNVEDAQNSFQFVSCDPPNIKEEYEEEDDSDDDDTKDNVDVSCDNIKNEIESVGEEEHDVSIDSSNLWGEQGTSETNVFIKEEIDVMQEYVDENSMGDFSQDRSSIKSEPCDSKEQPRDR